jgi:large subunit ribosomal protein L31
VPGNGAGKLLGKEYSKVVRRGLGTATSATENTVAPKLPIAYTAPPDDERLDGGAVKNEIHPEYSDITASCSCGNVIKTRSTIGRDIHLEVCSECHPFYTGKQKIVDSAGRVERFRQRFGERAGKTPT